MIRQLFIASIFMIALYNGHGYAQDRFFGSVKIEFEKVTSVRQLYKDLEENSSWFQQSQDRYPVSAKSYYQFTGDSTRSLYKPLREETIDPRAWYRPVADKNIVYTDYKTKTTISQKPVFDETFLVEDSVLKIKWKITSDVRTIAGYDCRKAIGILNDTIAVFAFYTDQLMITGGPESIQGLPGMILGVGIPRLHATWFATRVEVFDVDMKTVVPVAKGKKINRDSMIKSLEKVMKQRGTYGSKMMVNFII